MRALHVTLSVLAPALLFGCGTPATPSRATASVTTAIAAPSASASASAASGSPAGRALDWARHVPERRECQRPNEPWLLECEQGVARACWGVVQWAGKPECLGAGEVERYRLWESLCETVLDATGCAALGETLTTRLPPPHERPDRTRAVELLVAACDLARSPKGNRGEIADVCDRASYRLREAGDDRWLEYAKAACAESSVASCLRAMETLAPADRLKALVDKCDEPSFDRAVGDPVAACYEAGILARTPALANPALATRMMAAARKGALECSTGRSETCPTLEKFPEAEWPQIKRGSPVPTQPFWFDCRDRGEVHACSVALVDVIPSDDHTHGLYLVAKFAMHLPAPSWNSWLSARPWAFFARNTLAGWPLSNMESPYPSDPETAVFTAKQACYIDDASCDTLADVLRATGGDASAIDDANRRACAAGTARACTATKVP